MQRARDGRRREREHVHLRPQLLEPLLVLHAEALLLVDHQQPEVLERHLGPEQLVGADQNVDLALSSALQHLADLGRFRSDETTSMLTG